jgi:Flp pilus assembly protein TadD
MVAYSRMRVSKAGPRMTVALTLAIGLGACANQISLPSVDFAPPTPGASERPRAEPRQASAALVAKAQSDLKNTAAVIAAARALRTESDKQGALALVEKATAVTPKNAVLSREAGMLALELGRVSKAESALRKAIESGKPEWETYSALGSALASGGKHAEAQKQFAKALELSPDNPVVLNNLALSYALDGKTPEAERFLRIAAQAKSSPAQVKQNLALVLGARGKLTEAEKLATASSPESKAQNMAYLKSLAERAGNSAQAETGTSKSAFAEKPELPKPYLLGAKTSP